MLFDEPTSALDPELIGEVLTVMQKLAAETYDHVGGHPRDGLCQGSLQPHHLHGGGHIVEEGPPAQLFYNPKHPRTEEFLGKITELYGEE